MFSISLRIKIDTIKVHLYLYWTFYCGKFKSSERPQGTLPLSKVWVYNQKYEHMVQAAFKILIMILEEEPYENATSLINKRTNFFFTSPTMI